MASELDFRHWDRRQVGMDLTYPMIHGDGRAIGQFTAPVIASGNASFDAGSAYVPSLNGDGKLQSADNPTASFTFNNTTYEATMMCWFKSIAREGGDNTIFFQTHGSLHSVGKNAAWFSPITIGTAAYGGYANFQCYSQGGDNRGVYKVNYLWSSFTSTNWNHFCFVVKSTATGGDGLPRFYLNGSLTATGAVAVYQIARDMSGPVTFFSYYNNTTMEVAGRIQFASLMFRALTAQDIYSIYKTQLAQFNKA